MMRAWLCFWCETVTALWFGAKKKKNLGGGWDLERGEEATIDF